MAGTSRPEPARSASEGQAEPEFGAALPVAARYCLHGAAQGADERTGEQPERPEEQTGKGSNERACDGEPAGTHALGPDRYLAQARFSENRYGYAVLQVQNGEGLVSPLVCKTINAEVVKKAGMKMVADDCWLEDAKDPAGFLKAIAANAPAPTVKYVPVKPK